MAAIKINVGIRQFPACFQTGFLCWKKIAKVKFFPNSHHKKCSKYFDLEFLMRCGRLPGAPKI